MKFELLTAEQTKLEPTVPVKIQIDSTNDVELIVAGVEICYLSSNVGKLIMYDLSPENKKKLEELGFEMRGNEIAVG